MELLAHFAKRRNVSMPLLSDPDSATIRAFGILNEAVPRDQPVYGIPNPGTYIVDESGVVKAKFFEDPYRERQSAASILMHQFPAADGTAKARVETAHLQVTASASDAVVRSGSRILLALDIELKPRMHVYAPGVEGGYIPIGWSVTESPDWTAHPLTAPASEKLHLPAINETVLVYQGKFRLTRELTVGALRGPGRDLAVSGTFRYQACDDKVCYTPQDVPLSWNVRLEALDTQRAPEELRRKASTLGAR